MGKNANKINETLSCDVINKSWDNFIKMIYEKRRK
jgi:hypothetical protein